MILPGQLPDGMVVHLEELPKHQWYPDYHDIDEIRLVIGPEGRPWWRRGDVGGTLILLRTRWGLLEVATIEASQGYGPLLYDLGMELALVDGSRGVVPDRSGISEAAEQVWARYHESRSDVDHAELPYDYPDRDKHTLRHRHHLDLVYSKRDNPMWDELRAAGKIRVRGAPTLLTWRAAGGDYPTGLKVDAPSRNRASAKKTPSTKSLEELSLPTTWYHGTRGTFTTPLKPNQGMGGACVWLADREGAWAYTEGLNGFVDGRLIEVTLRPDTRVVDLSDTSNPAVLSFIERDQQYRNMFWKGRDDVTAEELQEAVAYWNQRKTHYDALEARSWSKKHFREAGADALLVKDVRGHSGFEPMPSLCVLNRARIVDQRDVLPPAPAAPAASRTGRKSFTARLDEFNQIEIKLAPIPGEWPHPLYGKQALVLLAHAYSLEDFRRVVAYIVETSTYTRLVNIPLEVPADPPKRHWAALDALWEKHRVLPLTFEPVSGTGRTPGVAAFLGSGYYDRVEIGFVVVQTNGPILQGCADSVQVLQHEYGIAPVIEVVASTIRYACLRGRGLGRKLYDALIDYELQLHPRGFYMMPNLCGIGDTSPDADRMWGALYRDHPHEGHVIFVGRTPATSRR